MYADAVPPVAAFECPACHRHLTGDITQPLCPDCSAPLLVRYHAAAFAGAAKPAAAAPPSIARYAQLLPDSAPLTLPTGWTPLLPSRRHPHLLVKNEAANPASSFHARGISVAVAVALHSGHRRIVAAAAGDEAVALAVYASAAGLQAHLIMPRADTSGYSEALACGATLTLLDDTLAACARHAAEDARRDRSLSFPLLDPFRIEGAKTLGLEIVEQLGWRYPQAIFCPLDDAILIGLWKAFHELEELGWVAGHRPKIIAIRTTVSAPQHADFLLREIIHPSGGRIMDLPDNAWQASLLDWARHEGILLCPHGAAAAAAWQQAREESLLTGNAPAVLIQPASGIRHLGVIAETMGLAAPAAKIYPQRTPVGGIITPQ
jgi:threonine synthase